MKKNDVFPSTFYKAKDVCDGPIVLTINSVAMEPVGKGVNKEDKPVAHFKEPGSKLLVVTKSKYDAIALVAESDDTDDWSGVKIVLEAGRTSFQGKLVDSIDIRAPRRSSSSRRPNDDEND
jgi:uncharacterized protein (UPF0333 family)